MRQQRRVVLLVSSALGLSVSLAACGSATHVRTVTHTVTHVKRAARDGAGGGAPAFNTATNGGATSAIAWAESFEAGQPNAASASSYEDYCALFVANAFGAAHSGFPTAWDMSQALTLHDPTDPAAAPRGSLMFFGPNSYNEGAGHVGIALGGGAMISANVPTHDIPGIVLNYPTPNVQSSSYWSGLYRGWAWPPASWGPLATQAAQGATSTAMSPPTNGSSATAQPAGGSSTVQGSSPTLQGGSSSGLQGSGTTLQGSPNTVQTQTAPAGQGGGAPTTTTTPAQTTPTTPTTPAAPVTTTTSTTPPVATTTSPPAATTTPPAATTPTAPPATTTTSAPASAPAPTTVAEITGSTADTFIDPVHESGPGQTIGAQTTVQISCRETGMAVQDGNTWWYRVASPPWNNGYWVSADAFYNGVTPGGSLINTPFVDPNVPTTC
jgi:hypothetical protein